MKLPFLKKKRALALIALSGLLILILVNILKPAVNREPDRVVTPLVSVHRVTHETIDPQITGFGRAFPQNRWTAISEVSGRVIFRHPELEKGRTIAKGTIILKIDDVDYQLAEAQDKAALKAAELELKRIDLNKVSIEQNLQLANSKLELAKKELKRKDELSRKGLISNSELEAQRSVLLAQEQAVWDAESKLALIPTDLQLASANLNSVKAKLAQSKRLLERTVVTMPFTGRIARVNAEPEQVVNPQQVLVEAYDNSLMEVTANMSVRDVKRMLQASASEASIAGETRPDVRNLNLHAQVVYQIGNQTMEWPAKVDRLDDGIDAAANTIGFTVQVINDPTNYDPKINPPLLNDMYVQVNVTAKGKAQVVIPSKAIHQNKVYVVDEQHKLRIRNVVSTFSQNGWSIVDSGLDKDEMIVTSDLLAPIDGMVVRIASESE